MQHRWIRDDIIRVLDYYYTMQKGDDRADNSENQQLAKLIGISPSSVVLRFLNCRTLYPRKDFPPVRTPASKLHKAVFEKFKNARSALRAEAARIKSATSALRRALPPKSLGQQHVSSRAPTSRQRQKSGRQNSGSGFYPNLSHFSG